MKRALEPMDRRRFVERLLLAGCGVAALGRCRPGGPSLEEIETRAKTYEGDLDCTETKGLWPVEVETRTSNEYVDRSTTPGEYCFRCTNYVAPEEAGTCASCRTVKGPIHPLGWCKAFTAARG